MIAVIMSGLPDAYDMVKTSLSGSTKLQTLTLNELETNIQNFYRKQLNKAGKTYNFGKEDEKSGYNEENKAMQAVHGGGGKNHVVCFHCGRKVHRISECFLQSE